MDLSKYIPKTIILSLIICGLCFAVYSQEIPWRVTEIIPGGRIDAIAYAENNVVIAGTRSPNPGWIFYSTDNGLSWQKGQQLPSSEKRMGVTCIAAAKNGLIFAINESSELYRSKDYGRNWDRMGKVSQSPRNGNWALSYGLCITKQGTLLISDTDSTGGSVYRSTDHGKTFTRIPAVSTKGLYRFDMVRNGIIVNGWAGCTYKSEDDGQTWQLWNRMDTTTALYATEYLRPETIVQASELGNIYESHQDNSTRMTKLANPGNGAAADDFVYLGFNTLIYTTYTKDRHVHISYDKGKHWVDAGPVPTNSEGDWLDHVISMEQEDSVIAIGGTRKGFIVRAAFANGDLYAKTFDREKFVYQNSLKKDFDQGLVGALYSPKELDEPEDVLVDGNYAYVPCRGSNNLAVIDISNPAKPRLASSFRDPELLDAMGVSKHGKYVYIASFSNHKCIVVDASDPSNLKKIFSFTVGSDGSTIDRLRKVVYHEGYLYLTHSNEGRLYIADAKNPANPKLISSIATGDGAFAVFIEGNYAYVGGCFPGSSVKVIDVKNKKQPKLITTLADTVRYKCTCSFQTENNKLVSIAYSSNSLAVFDLKNPAKPVEAGLIQSDQIYGPNRLSLIGKKAYIINSVNDCLAQIDISIPSKPVLDFVAPSWKLKKVYGMTAAHGLLYMAGRDSRYFLIVDPRKFDKGESHLQAVRGD